MSKVTTLDQPRCNFCPDYLTAEAYEQQLKETAVLLAIEGSTEPALMRTPVEADIPKIKALYGTLSVDDIRMRYFGAFGAGRILTASTESSSLTNATRNYDVVVEYKAEDKDAIIGHGGVVLYDGDKGDLHFVVDPSYRKNHLTTTMLTNVIRSAQAFGLIALTADIDKYNKNMVKPLRHAAERLGFNPDRMTLRLDPEDSGYLQWKLDISGSTRSAVCAVNGLVCQLDPALAKERRFASVQ